MLNNDRLFDDHELLDAQIFKPFNLREQWDKTLGKEVALDLENGPRFLSSLSREKRAWVRHHDISFRLGVIREVFLSYIKATVEVEQAKSRLDIILPDQKEKNRAYKEVQVVERVKKDANSWLSYCQALRLAKNWNAFSSDPQVRADWLEKLEMIEYPNQALIEAEKCLVDLKFHFKKTKEELTPTKVGEFVKSLLYPKKELEVFVETYKKYVKETTQQIKAQRNLLRKQMLLRLQHAAKENDPYNGHLMQGLLNILPKPPIEMTTLTQAVQGVYRFTMEQKQVFFTLLTKQNPQPLNTLSWFSDPTVIHRLRVKFVYHAKQLIVLPLNGAEIIESRLHEEKDALTGYLGPAVLPLIQYNLAKRNIAHPTDKNVITLLNFIREESGKAKQKCSLPLLAEAWEKTWVTESKIAHQFVSELLARKEMPSAEVLTAILAFVPLAPSLVAPLEKLKKELLKLFESQLEENQQLFLSQRSNGTFPPTDRLCALLPEEEGQALKRLTLCWEDKPSYQNTTELVVDFKRLPLGKEKEKLLTCTTLMTCQHPHEKRFVLSKEIDPHLTQLWYEMKKKGLGVIVKDIHTYLFEPNKSLLSDSEAIDSLKVIKAFRTLNPDLWKSVLDDVKTFYLEKWACEKPHNPAIIKLVEDPTLTYHYGLARFIHLLSQEHHLLNEEETLAELIKGHGELAQDVAAKIREQITKQPDIAPSAQEVAPFLSAEEKVKMSQWLDQYFLKELTEISATVLAARLEQHHPNFPQTPEAREQIHRYLHSLSQTSLNECRLIHLLGEEPYKKGARFKWLKEVLEGKRPPLHVRFFQEQVSLGGLLFIQIVYGNGCLEPLASLLEHYFSTPTLLTNDYIDVLKPFVKEDIAHTSRWALLTQQGRKKIDLSLKIHALLDSFKNEQFEDALTNYQELLLAKRLEAGPESQIYFSQLLAKVENELIQTFRVAIDDRLLSEAASFSSQVQKIWLGKLEEGPFKRELAWHCLHVKKLKVMYDKVQDLLSDTAFPLFPFLLQLEPEEISLMLNALPKRLIKGLRFSVSHSDLSTASLRNLESYRFFIEALGKTLSPEEINTFRSQCQEDAPVDPLEVSLVNLLQADGVPSEVVVPPSVLATPIKRWMLLQWQALLRGDKIPPLTKERAITLFTRLLILQKTLSLPNPTMGDLQYALSFFQSPFAREEKPWEQAFEEAYQEINRLDADWKQLLAARRRVLEEESFVLNDLSILHGIPSLLEPLELSRLTPVKQKRALAQLALMNVSQLDIHGCQGLEIQDVVPFLTTSLTHLNVSNCPALFPSLLPKLTACSQLTTLRMNNNPIQEFKAAAVFLKLAQLFLYDCRELTTLILDAPELIAITVNSPCLKELKVKTEAQRLILKVHPKLGAEITTKRLGDYEVVVTKDTTLYTLDCRKASVAKTAFFHWLVVTPKFRL